MYFVEIPCLDELEKSERWDDAQIMLEAMWKTNPDDLGVSMRLMSECRHVLGLCDCAIDNSSQHFPPDKHIRQNEQSLASELHSARACFGNSCAGILTGYVTAPLI